MYEYKVYLYLDNTLKECRVATFTSLERAEELFQIGLEEGCYKYILVVKDIEQDMPIETKSIYLDDYRQEKPRTRKRER